jgi:hypothetical protein
LVVTGERLREVRAFEVRMGPSSMRPSPPTRAAPASAYSGAVFDLTQGDRQRPLTWTSADAAGLPILPGLVRHQEILDGEIKHAIRFTVAAIQRGYVFPASLWASTRRETNLPPMGPRVRLKTSYNTSGFTDATKVILAAMKKYGMILADNGSDWFFTGESNVNWNDNDLNQLKQVPASQFEVVAHGSVSRDW